MATNKLKSQDAIYLRIEKDGVNARFYDLVMALAKELELSPTQTIKYLVLREVTKLREAGIDIKNLIVLL
jgi:hypothetical protein